MTLEEEEREDRLRELAQACIADGHLAVVAMRRWRWIMLLAGMPGFAWALGEFWAHHWIHGATLGAWGIGAMFVCEGLTDFIRLRQRCTARLEERLTLMEIEAIQRRLG